MRRDNHFQLTIASCQLSIVNLSSLVRGLFLLCFVLCAYGCSKGPAAAPKARLRPEVKAVQVEKRTIVRQTGQPGFIEAYEQTAIYPKIAGFVDEWKVDIGSPITKGMALAHLDVPDLVADFEEKKAEVELDEVRTKVAEELVKVARDNWKTAGSQVDEARENLGKYKADVEFWSADYKRVHKLFVDNAIDATVDTASLKHMQASVASEKAAVAGVEVARAIEAARKSDYEKAKIDVNAAQARTKVARATEKRLAAMIGYTTIRAPYDGIVVARNVNTGDFAQPAAGDPSAQRSNPAAVRLNSNPLYVVARIDKVRIFLDVPEMEASGIQPGSKASVNIPAVDNMEFSAPVTLTSWALNAKSRTLRAEIDIANPDGRIRPNMYAYGTVELTRTNVWAVPLEAVVQLGNQDCCYVLDDGKAVQLPVQLGIDDGVWVEVAKKRIEGKWSSFNGTEKILLGELPQLSNGEPVRIADLEPAKK